MNTLCTPSYTEEQILQLLQSMSNDDRLLDIEIASKVLNYEFDVIKPHWYHSPVFLFYNKAHTLIEYSFDVNKNDAIMFRNGNDHSDGHAQPLPHYSDDYEDCQLVIEAMIEREHSVSLRYSPKSKLWRASFGILYREEVEWPKAICRAALAELNYLGKMAIKGPY